MRLVWQDKKLEGAYYILATVQAIIMKASRMTHIKSIFYQLDQ